MSTGQASAGGNSISFTLVGPALTGFPAARVEGGVGARSR
jgi:hypothetical protein